MYKNRLDEKGIRLIRGIGTECKPIALVPHSLFTQVLDNLFSNAIKALEGRNGPEIRILIFQKAPKICITMQDNGTGLDSAIKARIFEAGFSGFGSSGLGLSIARSELSKLGARISVENRDDEPGVIVTLEFMEGTF